MALLLQIIQYLFAFSFIVPLVAGLRRIKYLDNGMRLLLLFLIINLLFEAIAVVLAIREISTAPVYNLLPPFEFTLTALMLYVWHDLKSIKKTTLGSIPLFFIIWGISYLTFSGKDNPDDVVLPIESILIVILAVVTMFTVMNRDQIPVLKNPIFWVSSALVVYFAGNLFLFALTPTLLKAYKEDVLRNVWFLHSLLNLIKNLLFLGGILACRTRSSYSSAAPSSS